MVAHCHFLFKASLSLKIDLGPVKGAVTLINVIGHFVILEGAFESGGRSSQSASEPMDFAGLVLSSTSYSNPKIFMAYATKISDGADFRIKLFRCAKDVGIVLRELAGPHKAMQDAGLFVPVDGAQFNNIAGADPGNCGSSIYRSACGTGSSWA